jgi:hypothetical protein
MGKQISIIEDLGPVKSPQVVRGYSHRLLEGAE